MRGISAVVGLVFFSLLLASVAILYGVYSVGSVDIQRASEQRQHVLQAMELDYIRIDDIFYDGNNLIVSFTAREDGIELNDVEVFINHRFVGSCGELDCHDQTGNGYLVTGEEGNVMLPYSGPCEVTVLLEYKGSTTVKSSNVCVWSCRRLLTITSSFSDMNYPVHVELNTSDFDFSKTDGSDLRFTDQNGTKLPYWVEYWTSTSASVWVRTDLAFGETNIYMYYCNPGAASESNGYSVFTVFNFNDANLLAVFHFDEGSGTTTYDSTGRYTGSFNGSPVWVSGKYGYALRFDGSSHVSTDYNELPSNLTYLLWVRAFSNNDYDRILYDGNWARVLAVYSTNVPYVQFSSTVSVATTAVDDNWHSLVVKVGGGYQSLWVDGVEEANDAISYVSPRVDPTLIGGDGTADFNGVVDELIMFGRLLSQEEINQLLSGYFDRLTSVWVVRKRMDPEPSVTIGPEETGTWVIN